MLASGSGFLDPVSSLLLVFVVVVVVVPESSDSVSSDSVSSLLVVISELGTLWVPKGHNFFTAYIRANRRVNGKPTPSKTTIKYASNLL